MNAKQNWTTKTSGCAIKVAGNITVRGVRVKVQQVSQYLVGIDLGTDLIDPSNGWLLVTKTAGGQATVGQRVAAERLWLIALTEAVNELAE